MHYRGISFVWLVIFGVASLVAQPLPPPITGGIVNIEVTVGEETRAVQHDYQPPKAATILAESVQQVRYSRATQVFVPGVAGSVTSTFTFDPDYAANHSEVDKPIRGYNPWHQSLEHYSRILLTTNWDAEGRKTFVLDATTYPGSATLQIEGRGRGGIFDSGGGPSALPIPMFHVADVTKATGKVVWFYWGTGHVYRHLPGINDYWADRQADGTTAVFHLDFFSEPAAELREYEPIGVVATAGTPGHGPSYETVSEALTEAGAFADLRDADWAFTGEFTPTIEPSAHYSFTGNVATASKLRYKLVVQPGLARTITWAETFTPDGAGEPSDIRFLSEDVTAVTTETQVHTLDPFARFGSQPGRYQVLAFEAESFEAGLTVDTNRDGKIIPAAGPITGYVINNADLTSIAKPYGFMINVDDDDSDGTADNVDLQVNGPEDLADFFPVFLNIKQLLSTLPAGTKCILKHAEGAVNFVYTDLKQATAFTYLNNPETGFGPNFDQSAATATAQQITSIGVELSEEFVNRIRYQNQGVILVEFRTPTRQPLTLTIATGTGVFVITLPLQATLGELAVDANRDGTIKHADEDDSDVTSANRPFRYWVNDDFDGYGDAGPPANDAIPDSSRGDVAGVNDLKDFFPVFLDIKGLISAFPPDSGATYKLKQADGALKFVYTSLNRATALSYKNPPYSYASPNTYTYQITAEGVPLIGSFVRDIKDYDQGVILVEGTAETTQPLVLTVEKNGVTIAELSLPLSIGQDIVLLLHGMNSNTGTWQQFVDSQFPSLIGFGAPIVADIRDGEIWGNTHRNSAGVVCYRVQFGAYDLASPRVGLEGVKATDPGYDTVTKRCGDFETFEELGNEVEDAITLLRARHKNTRIVVVGHSRGGLAARAFLQGAVSTSDRAAAKAVVVGLLTTSSPHLGSRMGRIYGWLNTHQLGFPETDVNDWEVVNFLLGAGFPWAPLDEALDVRRPVILDVADNSQAIADLNAAIALQNIPASIRCTEIQYANARFGLLAREPVRYSVFEPTGFLGGPLPQLSDAAKEFLMAGGDPGDIAFIGDGLIPRANQRFTQLNGFSAVALPARIITGREVVHIEAPKQSVDLVEQLKIITPEMFP